MSSERNDIADRHTALLKKHAAARRRAIDPRTDAAEAVRVDVPHVDEGCRIPSGPQFIEPAPPRASS